MTPEDKEKIQSELEQLREHIQDMANTKVGDKYIFSGTKTATPLYDKEWCIHCKRIPAFSKNVEIEVFDGVTMNVNTNVDKSFKGY